MTTADSVLDLASFHRPVGDLLFAGSSVAIGADAYQLSPDQLACFAEHGYVAGVPILSPQQAKQLREELTGIMDPAHPGHHLFHEFHSNESPDPARVLFHALGAWRITQGFHDLLWHPAFLTPAAQLLQGGVRFWHDQLFCKPAHHGGVVAWHQDYSYWTRTEPMQHLTCWIALDDATVDNGCLQYVPGSHRWDLLPITGLAGDMHAIQRVLSPEQWEALQNPVAIELSAGQAAFHHPLMVHGSGENNTDRSRRATVLNVFRDGVRSGSAEPLLQGVPSIPPGEPVQGTFFPLLRAE